MPVVTIKVPEAKDSPAMAKLSRQFADFQKSALKSTAAPSTDGRVLTALLKQQDAMLKAIERMMARMGNGHAAPNQDALLDALKGLKKVLAGLPGDLKGAMTSSMRHQVAARPEVTVQPKVTVSMNGLEKKFDQLQTALVAATKRSRNRTFGSNY